MKDAIRDKSVGGGKIEMLIESREKVTKLLKELFQFDMQDLDFGIYRIMNFKREEIEHFIEEDLFTAAEDEFKAYAKAGLVDLQKEIEKLKIEINRDFGEGTIDEQGQVIRHKEAPKLQEYMTKMKDLERVEVTQAQMEEVFNHIYEFFSRYYDKGDFISKRRYGGREKYYVPYDGEEVHLHWATADQYYVKTGEYFKKYSFTTGRYRVNFVLKEADTAINNTKRGNRYFLLHDGEILTLDEANKELDIHFNYRELREDEKRTYGTRNIQDKITAQIVKKVLSKVGDQDVGVFLQKKDGGEKTTFETHLRRYVTRNTTDYFIHKKLKSFLERELEFYLKNEVWDLDELEYMDERNIRITKAKVRAIQTISRKIIDFVVQIEEFQKKLFEKKKFILQTNYFITLDRIPEEFYEEIGKNEQQVVEWKKIFKLDETTKNTLYSTLYLKSLDINFLKLHKNLVVDTKFFDQNFKDHLLENFEKLDENINGLLLKSENWHVLNLLNNKYGEKIKSIYIDPPYNTENDRRTGKFLYKDNYAHSSWATLMNNRIEKTINLLNKFGTIFISIDDNEQDTLKLILKRHFNFIRVIPVISNLKGNQDEYGFAGTHEYLITGAFNPVEGVYGRLSINEEELLEWEEDEYGYYKKGANLKATGINAPREKRPNLFFPIFITTEDNFYITENDKIPENRINKGDVAVYPLTNKNEMSWRWSKEKISNSYQDIILVRNSNNISIYKKQRPQIGELPSKKPKSFFYKPSYSSGNGTREIKNLFNQRFDVTPKPLELIKDIISISSSEESITLDFFAGTGTTAHAVMILNKEQKSNRKFILVEMADYFDTLMLPRIKKIAYSFDWKNGKPLLMNGSGIFCKYQYLEQYEDTLNNIEFKQPDGTIQRKLDQFPDYFLTYMLDYETQDSPTRIMIDQFQAPFDYKLKLNRTGDKDEFTPVDLVETFNYLLGLHVEKLRTLKDSERIYRAVFGKKKDDNIVIIWRNTKDLDLVEDKQFIEKTILLGHSPDQIFVNGDSYVKNAKAIEPEFKRLMGA